MKRLDIVNDEEMLVHQKVSYLFILHYELIFVCYAQISPNNRSHRGTDEEMLVLMNISWFR